VKDAVRPIIEWLQEAHDATSDDATSEDEDSGRAPRQPQSERAGAVLTQLLAKTVFVAGLPDEHSVRAFCGRFGAVLGVTVVQSSSKSKPWAFVTLFAPTRGD
jgi:hypothetical protein